jgi:hypothetical protein
MASAVERRQLWKVDNLNDGSGSRDGDPVYANVVWSMMLLEANHLLSLSPQRLCPCSIVTCTRVRA